MKTVKLSPYEPSANRLLTKREFEKSLVVRKAPETNR